MGFKKADEFYISLGLEKTSVQVVVNKILHRLKAGQAVAEEAPPGARRRAAARPHSATASSDLGIEIDGLADVLVRLAKCCKPVPGDPILGYISLGRGITIHREDCPNAQGAEEEPRAVHAGPWGGANQQSFRVEIAVDAWDRVRLLEDLSRAFAESGVNIISANCAMEDQMVHDRFTVEVGDVETLKSCDQQPPPGGLGLRRLPGDAGQLIRGARRAREAGARATCYRPAPMEWLDLVVPSAAILALFGVVALVYRGDPPGARHPPARGAARRARRGVHRGPAPAHRRAPGAPEAVSSGRPAYIERQLRTAGIVALAALALVLAIGGVWYLFVRDDGGAPRRATRRRHHDGGQPAPRANAAEAGEPDAGPGDVPGPSTEPVYTVAVFNASGVSGAAGDIAAPKLEGDGWNIASIANEPDGDTGRQESVVMYTRGKRKVAWNVAKDLGIKRAPPVDGYTAEQYGNADVVVLVGLDLANGGATPTP